MATFSEDLENLLAIETPSLEDFENLLVTFYEIFKDCDREDWHNAWQVIETTCMEFVDRTSPSVREAIKASHEKNCIAIVAVRNRELNIDRRIELSQKEFATLFSDPGQNYQDLVTFTLRDFMDKVKPIKLPLFNAVNFANTTAVVNASNMVTGLII